MANSEVIRVYNCSKQTIPLQVRPVNSDFYRDEQQVRLAPGKSVLLSKKEVMESQIKNLQTKRMIKVVYDSSKTDS